MRIVRRKKADECIATVNLGGHHRFDDHADHHHNDNHHNDNHVDDIKMITVMIKMLLKMTRVRHWPGKAIIIIMIITKTMMMMMTYLIFVSNATNMFVKKKNSYREISDFYA